MLVELLLRVAGARQKNGLYKPNLLASPRTYPHASNEPPPKRSAGNLPEYQPPRNRRSLMKKLWLATIKALTGTNACGKSLYVATDISVQQKACGKVCGQRAFNKSVCQILRPKGLCDQGAQCKKECPPKPGYNHNTASPVTNRKREPTADNQKMAKQTPTL